MYYHCRPLKYVRYGKIKPPPEKVIDDDFICCYKWLGQYCGYCPQIWLSRSKSCLTGYRSSNSKKEDFVMFGFDVIEGFCLDFDTWAIFIHSIMTFCRRKINPSLIEINENIYSDLKEYLNDDGGFMKNFKDKSFEEILDKVLFVENDQVVVPSLNLKVAKQIFCRTEKVKRKLRKLGFIEDRIKIMPNQLNNF